MKIILITLVAMISGSIEFQDLLGKNISESLVLGGKPILFSQERENSYFIIPESAKDFLGKTYKQIFVNTDENQNIQEITIYIPEVIDSIFYYSLVEKYGYPNIILVLDKMKSTEKSKGPGEFSQVLIKRSFTLKEGAFKDNPYLIYWTKEAFQIQISIKHAVGSSEITYRVPRKGL